MHKIRRPIDRVNDPEPISAYAYDAASVNAVRLIKSRNDVAINYLFILSPLARTCLQYISKGICARIFACCDTLFPLSQFSISFVRFTLDEVKCTYQKAVSWESLRHSGFDDALHLAVNLGE